MNTLTKIHFRRPKGNQIVNMMEAIGVPREEICASNVNRSKVPRTHSGLRQRNTFWEREQNNLHYWAERIQSAFRNKMKKLHPDNGGSTPEAIELNMLYDRISRLFAKRGIIL